MIVSAPGRQPAGHTKIKQNCQLFQYRKFIYSFYLLHVYQYIEKLEEVEVFHQLIDQQEDHSL